MSIKTKNNKDAFRKKVYDLYHKHFDVNLNNYTDELWDKILSMYSNYSLEEINYEKVRLKEQLARANSFPVNTIGAGWVILSIIATSFTTIFCTVISVFNKDISSILAVFIYALVSTLLLVFYLRKTSQKEDNSNSKKFFYQLCLDALEKTEKMISSKI